ncbi:unnamed protein product [marine sediment metagenome]|uniref:Uncharacterized protein n=1 Tax=marine sediment metagenome TaxID=412755 RepID=X1V4I0_9ZZZZ
MRERKEIERDFNAVMGMRKGEFLEFKRQKILIEVMLDIREILREVIKVLGGK